jgi:hypothetical protein
MRIFKQAIALWFDNEEEECKSKFGDWSDEYQNELI